MMDRIAEWIELLLVNLGMALTQISAKERTMISLFLASLLLAAVASRALYMLVLR